MNHPTKEQWMDYLYGEIPAQMGPELEKHLQTCAACRQQVEIWRGAMVALDAWQLPAITPNADVTKPIAWAGVARWAAAAIVVVGIGFGLGRFSAPTPDLAGVETRLRRDFQQQLTAQQESHRQTLASLADRWKEERGADRRAVVGLLQEMAARNQNDLAELRRDLETVAVMTDGSLRQAQDQIVKLAALSGGETGK